VRIKGCNSQLFGKSVAAEALGEYFVSLPGKVRLLEDQILQLFKDKYPWLSEREWRALMPRMKEYVIEDPIPVNNMAIVPRNSSHTEDWFKAQPKWRELQQQGYTSVIETKRTPVTGMNKIKVEITASGQGVSDRKLYYDFDKRPTDAALIAGAETRVGLPGVSEYKVEQRSPTSLDLSVVARRTAWVIENVPIEVSSKAVRGGRTQSDWHASSTFTPPPP
jgi:hypothetical protein